MDPQKPVANGNGWGEYKREVLLRLDQVEGQLDEIEDLVTKIDRDMVRLIAQRGMSRLLHNFFVPAVVAGFVAWVVRYL